MKNQFSVQKKALKGSSLCQVKSAHYQTTEPYKTKTASKDFALTRYETRALVAYFPGINAKID